MSEQPVEVVFEPVRRSARIAPGLTLLAAAESIGFEILTGCTVGMCGTDAVQVTAGAAGLSTPEDPELGTLERMGLGPEFRLACSARVLRGCVHVKIDAF
jgi:ferredoxin